MSVKEWLLALLGLLIQMVFWCGNALLSKYIFYVLQFENKSSIFLIFVILVISEISVILFYIDCKDKKNM